MISQRLKLISLSCMILCASATSFWGCKSCADNDNTGMLNELTDPWQDDVDTLASYVPADASSVLFGIDFTAALATYPGFRARVSTYIQDYATIEADFRNTLGVDFAHPNRLKDIGVDPRGGVVCFMDDGQSVCATRLSDEDTFATHVTTVAQGQPFNLRAPVVSTELPSGGTLLRFASKEGAAPQLALVHNANMGFLVMKPKPESLDAFAQKLETKRETSLRDREVFQKIIDHGEKASIFWWISPEALGDLAKTIPELAGIQQNSFQKPVMQGAVVGLRLHSDAIDGWYSLLLDDTNDKISSLLIRKEDIAAADFSKLVQDDAYALVRMHADPKEVSRIIRTAIEPKRLEGTSDKMEDVLGQDDLEQGLQKALGYDFLIQATRARLLTLAALMRGGKITAEALGDGLGIIGAFQLRDADALRSVFQDIQNARPGTIQEVTSDDEPSYWTIPNGPAKNIVIYIDDQTLIVSTKKQVPDIQARIQASEPQALTAHSIEEVEAFRGATDDLGIFVNLHSVANNSLGKIAGSSLPEPMRDAIQIFDEFWARGSLHDNTWFDGTFKIRLTTPER